MVSLTKDQKEIQKRIKASIEKEIGMCDDYADLIILASTLYSSSKHIVNTYTMEFGEDATAEALKQYKD